MSDSCEPLLVFAVIRAQRRKRPEGCLPCPRDRRRSEPSVNSPSVLPCSFPTLRIAYQTFSPTHRALARGFPTLKAIPSPVVSPRKPGSRARKVRSINANSREIPLIPLRLPSRRGTWLLPSRLRALPNSARFSAARFRRRQRKACLLPIGRHYLRPFRQGLGPRGLFPRRST